MAETFYAQPAKRRRGCLFYGCLISIGLVILLGVGGYLAFQWGLDKLAEYTDSTPRQLPASTMQDAEYRALEQRVGAFQQGLATDRPIETLVLDSKDLNALIARDPAWAFAKGKVHATISGDEIKGDVSIPLADIVGQFPLLGRLKDRYLNGTAGFKVVLVDDILVVSLRTLEIKGQAPPFVDELRKQNLAEKRHTPDLDRVLKQLDSIRVQDGKLTLRANPKR